MEFWREKRVEAAIVVERKDAMAKMEALACILDGGQGYLGEEMGEMG